jgi:membrane protease YdiL (CAAX protease family)
MPSASVILEQLFQIANRYRELAIAWHLLVALVLILVGAGWRPSRRVGVLLLAGPLVSVAVLARLAGNPFNSAVFGLLALSLLVIGSVGAGPPLRVLSGYERVLPVALIGFGLVYPHFVQGASWFTYLHAAPFGLLPCPTLALVTGVTLLVRGLDARPWCWLLAAAGFLYGLLGVLRLGVYLDLPLLVGVVALLIRAEGERAARILRLRPSDGLLLFFVLAFTLSWGGVMLLISRRGLHAGETPGLASAMLVFLAMLAGPSLASVGLTAWLQGRAGLQRLGAAVRRWRQPLRWYALVALAPLLLLVLLLVLSLGWPRFVPDIFSSEAPGQLAASALLVGLAAGCFEELGWTGFATPRLLARFGVVRAGVTLGVPWALWHGLADYWGSAASFGSLWPAHMAEWVVALTAFRVLMTWAYARTGSLPLAMAMHAGFTGGQALLWPGTLTPVEGLIWYGWFGVMLWLLVAWFVPPQGSRLADADQALHASHSGHAPGGL